MDNNCYRQEVRKHFMGHIQNPQQKQTFRQAYLPELLTTKNFNEQPLKTQQKINELEAYVNGKERNTNQTITSGGDADRMLFCRNYATHHTADSSKIGYRKPSAPLHPSSNANISRKYQTRIAAEDGIGDYSYLYENDSNLDGIGNGSEDSAKSQKSSKTVVSRKSSQGLRKIVASQCKLHDVFDETIKQMCNTEIDNTAEGNTCGLQAEQPMLYPLTLNHCKRCTERIHSLESQKDVTTEIGKGDFLDCRNTNTLTISVDDVVNSRVINPMIRKLQRMYVNNLKEEMSLMEDLERLPYKVNEVYKSIIFKPKD